MHISATKCVSVCVNREYNLRAKRISWHMEPHAGSSRPDLAYLSHRLVRLLHFIYALARPKYFRAPALLLYPRYMNGTQMFSQLSSYTSNIKYLQYLSVTVRRFFLSFGWCHAHKLTMQKYYLHHLHNQKKTSNMVWEYIEAL